ncbi:hypothetical protein ECRM12761_27900 (plasmid) [Escherichia coli O145:H28 str. RM12761]|nr:hypothetical protein ECRM13516_5525 [Escherichia coli O145:H28 str. RM13516]AHY68497.1 hypothetical protein ECRM12761_27900 [Escherichia coli O145:H28 str. RM12761]
MNKHPFFGVFLIFLGFKFLSMNNASNIIFLYIAYGIFPQSF